MRLTSKSAPAKYLWNKMRNWPRARSDWVPVPSARTGTRYKAVHTRSQILITLPNPVAVPTGTPSRGSAHSWAPCRVFHSVTVFRLVPVPGHWARALSLNEPCWMAVRMIPFHPMRWPVWKGREWDGSAQTRDDWPFNVNNIYMVSRDNQLLFMLSDGNREDSNHIRFFRLTDPTVGKPL